MIVTNKRRFEMEIKTLDNFLKLQQEYEPSIIRLPKEIKLWFRHNKSGTFSRGQLHPQKIRKVVFSSEEWFKSASVANLNPKFYYMKGYNKQETESKILEMKEKNSKGVQKSFDNLSNDEKSERCDSSSKEFFQKKFGNDWETHYNHKLDRIYPTRIGYWLNRGYSAYEAELEVKKFQSNSSKKMWTKRINGEITTPFNTQIEYYMLKGESLEESALSLKNRQATFSKDKLINKYGDNLGLKKFEDRQQKWQETLNKKTDKEKEIISQEKGTDKNGIPHMGRGGKKYFANYPEKANVPAILYYLRFFNNETEFWKIGITTRTVEKRFGSLEQIKAIHNLEYEIIFENENTLENCQAEEQDILKEFNEKRIKIDINNFRSTECFMENIFEENIH